MNRHKINCPKSIYKYKGVRFATLACLVLLVNLKVLGQEVSARIDKDSIRIGEQINYEIEVVTDSTDLVIFPEGQTFSPLETIESFKADTSFASAKMKLIKKYALTQFDSGVYTIPQQRVSINQKQFLTDSLPVEVATVQIDTTKQGLYDIKAVISVEHGKSRWLEYVLWIVGILLVIGAFLFWAIRRSRKKAEAEKKLPPFDQALASLRKLDEEYKTPGRGAEQSVTKAYYSRLTDIVRRYLDEEVYDRSMESTTSELIEHLYLEKESGHVDFSKETILKLEHVLKTADLTKFARISPQEGQAEADRLTVEQVVKETKEVLPEPTLEELMRDKEYRETLARKRKRKLVLTSIFGVLGILILAAGILIATKGFDYVKDTYIGHPSKELLEGDWIRSEYGFPPVTVSTPKVLKRVDYPLPTEMQGQMEVNAFSYGSFIDRLNIIVTNVRYAGKQEADLEKSVDGMMKSAKSKGVKNLLVKNEKYTTPNGSEGLKTFGTGEFPEEGNPNEFNQGEYVMLSFTAPGVVQQILVSWRKDDKYAEEIADRIINSVELQKPEN